MSKKLGVKKVAITNFLTFADRQELVLENRGIVGIQGENLDDASASSNGSGKSAIPDAVVWCLYGRTMRGLKGDDVVNRFVGHDCEVELPFSDGTTDYVLTRYRKHRKFKNQLELKTASGTRLTKGSIDETQEEVDKLIGMDFDTLSALLCGQGILQPFSAMTDAQAKEAIEQLANTVVYGNGAKLASRKAQEFEGKVGGLRESVEEYEKSLADVKVELRDLRDRAKKAQQERKSRIEAAEDDVRALEKQADRLLAEIKQGKAIKAKVRELEQQEKDWEDDWKRANQAYIQLHRDVEVKRDQLTELASHKKEVGQLCTRCGGKIDRSNLAALLISEEKALNELEAMLPVKKQLRDEAADNLTDVRHNLTVKRGKLQQAGRLENQLLDKQREIDGAKKRLRQVATDVLSYDDLIDKASARKERIYQRLQEARQELTEIEPLYEAYKFWSAGFGNKGLKSLVLDDMLPFLNDRAAAYSRIMTDDNLQVRFRTTAQDKSGNEVDRFGVDVVNRHGGQTYQANSAGERRKVDIVVSLAFLAYVASQANSMLSCIFLDEVFDGLDAEGLERALTIITEELGDYESVFVISHRQDLADYFQHSITVTKHNNRSVIKD